jgi:hypothetical protein
VALPFLLLGLLAVIVSGKLSATLVVSVLAVSTTILGVWVPISFSALATKLSIFCFKTDFKLVFLLVLAGVFLFGCLVVFSGIGAFASGTLATSIFVSVVSIGGLICSVFVRQMLFVVLHLRLFA